MRGSGQLHPHPSQRPDGHQAAVPDLPGPQRASSTLVARGPGLQRGRRQKVLLSGQFCQQPWLGADQVRTQASLQVRYNFQ